MPPTSTRTVLRQKLLRRIDPKFYPITSTTTAVGTTTTLKDGILAPASQGENFIGSWVYIAELVTNGPAIGEIARITNVDFSGSNSTLTFAPAMTNNVQSGTDYEIHRIFHPSILHQKITDVLDELETNIIIPITLISGGAMEGTPATDFTASNATLANETTTVLHGRKALKVTATAANGQGRSATVSVYPSKEYLVAADVYITAGDSAKLIFYDITNSANIDTAESAATGWVHFEFKADTPATCEQAALYLESQANTDVTYWDNAILLQTASRSSPYPSTIEYADEIVTVFYFPLGTKLSASTDDNAYALLEKPSTFYSHATVERDETAVVPYRLELEKESIEHPIWIEGRVDFDSLSSDTATTVAPKEVVTELAYAKILDDLAIMAREDGDNDKYLKLLDEAAKVRTNVDAFYRGYKHDSGVIYGAKR